MLLRQNKYNIASERMCVMAKRREHKLKMTWFYGVIDVDVCVCDHIDFAYATAAVNLVYLLILICKKRRSLNS